MTILSILAFYLSILFGFVPGLIMLFHIGRLGWDQIVHWLVGFPSHRTPDSDNAGAVATVLDIPTSGGDVVATIFGAGPAKSFMDITSYLLRNFGNQFYYVGTLFGRGFARAFVLICVPSFVFSVIVDRALGYEYWPAWLAAVGIRSGLPSTALVVTSYVIAYLMGRLVGSHQRTYNKAR